MQRDCATVGIIYNGAVSEGNHSPSKRWHFIAALLSNRRLAWGLLIGGAIYGVLAYFRMPVIVCPWKQLTTLPCPGCGMTRSTMALLHGDFLDSLRHNALTWVILLFWLIVAIGLALPRRLRGIWIEKIGSWEQRSRWGLWFAGILIIYTLTRWVIFS